MKIWKIISIDVVVINGNLICADHDWFTLGILWFYEDFTKGNLYGKVWKDGTNLYRIYLMDNYNHNYIYTILFHNRVGDCKDNAFYTDLFIGIFKDAINLGNDN